MASESALSDRAVDVQAVSVCFVTVTSDVTATKDCDG